MPWIRGNWRPTEGEARVAITGGYYGDEFTDRENELDTLVDAVRRDWTERLRKLRDEQYGPSTFKAERNAIDRMLNELDPDRV